MAPALLALSGVLLGCVSPAAPAKPPGGGQRLVLSFDGFKATVSPVLERNGCDAGGDCHGGGIRGTLQLSPAGAKNQNSRRHRFISKKLIDEGIVKAFKAVHNCINMSTRYASMNINMSTQCGCNWRTCVNKK